MKDELDICNCVLEWALIWTTDKTTWSPVINELVEKGAVDVSPYDLELDYDYWSYGMANRLRYPHEDSETNCFIAEIASAVLPEEMEEVPQGFTQVGHVCMFLPNPLYHDPARRIGTDTKIQCT